MESTSLDDVLYRYASFRNLVDPITHDLIISLARYIHCPKPVGAMVSSRSGTVLAWETGNVELLLECQGKILSVFGGFGSRGSGFAAEQVIFGDIGTPFGLCVVFLSSSWQGIIHGWMPGPAGIALLYLLLITGL